MRLIYCSIFSLFGLTIYLILATITNNTNNNTIRNALYIAVSFFTLGWLLSLISSNIIKETLSEKKKPVKQSEPVKEEIKKQ